jgi:hypothetical protein
VAHLQCRLAFFTTRGYFPVFSSHGFGRVSRHKLQRDISRRHISDMENGKHPIGKANAKRLAEAPHIDLRLVLSI